MGALSPFEQLVAAQKQADQQDAEDNQSLLWKLLGYVGRPGQATMSGGVAALKGEDPLASAMTGLQGHPQYTGRDLMTTLGAPQDSGWTTAGGVAADMLNPLDPLLYVGGLGGLTKAGKLARGLGAADEGLQAIKAGATAADKLVPLAKDWGDATNLNQRALLSFMGHRIPIPGDAAAVGALQDAGNAAMGSAPGQWLTQTFGKAANRASGLLSQMGVDSQQIADHLSATQAQEQLQNLREAEGVRMLKPVQDLPSAEGAEILKLYSDVETSGGGLQDMLQRVSGTPAEVNRKTAALLALHEVRGGIEARNLASGQAGSEFIRPDEGLPHGMTLMEAAKPGEYDAGNAWVEQHKMLGPSHRFPEGDPRDNPYTQQLLQGSSFGIQDWNISQKGAVELTGLENPTYAHIKAAYEKLGVGPNGAQEQARFLAENGRKPIGEIERMYQMGEIPVRPNLDPYEVATTEVKQAAQAEATTKYLSVLHDKGMAPLWDDAKHNNGDWYKVADGPFKNAPLAVPKEFTDRIVQMGNQLNPANQGPLLGQMGQALLSFWKGSALFGLPYLPIRPQFWFRNIANGLWKQWLDGMGFSDMAKYHPMAQELAYHAHWTDPAKWDTTILTEPATGLQFTVKDLMDQYEGRNISGMGGPAAEILGQKGGSSAGLQQAPSDLVKAMGKFNERAYRHGFAINNYAEMSAVRGPHWLWSQGQTWKQLQDAGVAGLEPGTLIRPGGLMEQAPKAALPEPLAALANPTPKAEWVAQTAVKDAEGNPIRVYHGTGNDFESFDTNKLSPDSLYGPGVYTTESADVAGGYAESGGAQKGANVRPSYLDIRKPFDIDAPADPRLLGELQQKAASSLEPKAPVEDLWLQKQEDWLQEARADRIRGLLADAAKPGTTNQKVYELADELLGGVESGKAPVNRWLQEQGYDGITHTGGRITGGEPHKVWIAFSPDQVKPAFNEGTVRDLKPPVHPTPTPTVEKPHPVDTDGVHPTQTLIDTAWNRVHENAQATVYRSHFNYADISPTERRYFRGFLVPFWTWYRNNIPHELENMATQFGKYVPLAKGYRSAYDTQGLTPEDMPAFLRDTMNLPLGKDANGNPTVGNVSGLFPTMDVTDLISAFTPGGPADRDMMAKIGAYAGTKTNPLLQEMAQLSLGKSFLSGRDIRQDKYADIFGLPMGQKTKELLEGFAPPVQALDVLNPPVPGVAPQGIWSALGQASGYVGDEGQRPGRNEPTPGWRVLRAFTGVKPYSVDPQKEADMSAKQLKRLKGEYKGAAKRARQDGNEGEAQWYDRLAEQAAG